ncbi:MAG: OstA-like protein [Ginsengibacter sp.]
MKAIIICCGFLFLIFTTKAQQVNLVDSVKIIQIVQGKSFRHKTIDSANELLTIAGNAVLRQGTTLFSCDSVTLNKKTNVIESFGNVKINQADTIQIYSQYLKYQGNEQQAYLTKNVKLVDRKGSLYTQILEYNLHTGIGKYHTGGRVVNNKTVITSKEGIYYADTKDIYFIDKVKVIDPQNNISGDTLLYNMQTEAANFMGPTRIKNNSATIFTNSGSYDLKNNSGIFKNRSTIVDSSRRTYTADNIAFDKQSGNAQLEGNAVIKDSVDGFITLGNLILLNNNNNSFLATRKPVLLIIQNKDTTYVSGDTLFSAFTEKKTSIIINKPTKNPEKDSLQTSTTDSTLVQSLLNKHDTVDINKSAAKKKYKSDSVRFFIAFHHVKIYNDSLQSVSDSLYYSTADSVFKLFQQPVVWSGVTQITGDTMLLFTKNKKADRLYVFNNALVVSHSKGSFYNQMTGKTLNGYFENGEINYLRDKGSPAESIYYLQDKDSAYVGMNRATGDVIDIFFAKSAVTRVKFINDVHGILNPIRMLTDTEKFLKNFKLLDKRRPKNKLELFE